MHTQRGSGVQVTCADLRGAEVIAVCNLWCRGWVVHVPILRKEVAM